MLNLNYRDQFYFVEGEYTIPYWIDENLRQEYPKEFFIKNSTNIFLPFKENFLYKEDIEKKIKDIEPIVILFLNKLNNIQIIEHSMLTLDVQKQSESFSDFFTKTLIIHEKKSNEFYIARKVIYKPSSLEETKREKVSRREIVMAFPDFTNTLQEDRIFSFLPTEIRTSLPFLIQADFILIGNRENIIEDNRWNLWLLAEIVTFFVEVFHALQTVDKYNYLRYLDQERSSNKFIDTYYQKMLKNLEDKKLFLTIDEQFVKASNIAILEDFEFMFKYLEEVDYQNENDEKYVFLHESFYIPKHIEKNWQITKIDKRELLRIIGDLSEYFAQKFENDNILFEQLLTYIGNGYKDKNILNALPIIPIDEDGNVKFYSKKDIENYQIFFELDNHGVLNNVFPNLKIVSKKYREQIEKMDFFRSILEIKNPDIAQILSSIKDDFFKNIENNVNLLVYIKNNYEKNKDEIISLLEKNYKFLNKNNTFVQHDYGDNYYQKTFSINLYISKEYIGDTNCIENIVEKYCNEAGKSRANFISEKYIEKDKLNSKKDIGILRKEWIEFFNKLKINDNLKIENHLDIPNISFFIAPDAYSKYFMLDKLNKEDSIFLFRKIITSEALFSGYDDLYTYLNRIPQYDRRKKDEYVSRQAPWVTFIKDNFPIYIKNEQLKIKDIYLNVDEKLEKFFKKLSKDYAILDVQKAKKIFNLKDKPTFEDVLHLVNTQILNDFEDIKSLFKYLHYEYEKTKISISQIPIFKDKKIEYVSKEKLIWKDGRELGLIEVESSYGDDFKRFFIDQLGIVEKPTIEQFVNHLKTKPKNYWNLFYKFISLLSKDIEKNEEIREEEIILIGNVLYSFDEIIFNDELLENCDHIKNLLTIEKKYHSHFKNIIDAFDIELLSSFERE